MNSILIQHKSLKSLEESELYKRLLKEIFNSTSETITNNKELGKRLAALFSTKSLPVPVIKLLSRPWQRAYLLAAWNDKLNLPERKKSAKSIVERLRDFRKDFTALHDIIAPFMLFENTVELDINNFSYNMDEVIKFFEDFIQHKFAPGEAYSTDYFKRYALNSLFYMGKKMGLSEKGNSPTQLNEFIHIITNRLYADVGQDHGKFKKIDFIAKYELNKNNTPLIPQ